MPDAPTAPSAHPANALPPGTRLGEFEVLDVLGVGGFGIVYLALDHALERQVAIKEYMPASLAGRSATLHVSVRSPADADTFALGLRSFVNEAKLLARFDHPSLLKVYRFWEANDTAYLSMPVYRGQTLKAVRAAMPAPPDEAWLRALLVPLLGAIETLHGQAVYHRDIAPDNILVEADGRPVLLDFGAARRVIGDHSQALTAILKPAYAPIEQYAEASSLRQGPWTDLYALGATLYFALTGQAPAPSTARTVVDDQLPLATRSLPGCSAAFLQVIDWMLAPRPADRPQSVAALRAVLDGSEAVPTVAASSTGVERTRVRAEPPAASAASAMAPTLVDAASQPSADLPLDLPAPPSVQAAPSWERPRRKASALPVLGACLVAGSAAVWWWWPEPTASGFVPSVALAASSAAALAGSGAASARPEAPARPAEVASPAPVPANPSARAPAATPARTSTTPSAATPPARPPPLGSETRPATAAVPASAQRPLPPPQAAPSAPAATTAQPVAPTASASPGRPAPARAAASVPLSDEPEAICGRRVLLAQVLCMERACRTDEFAKHPACRKWWQQNRTPRP